MTVPNENKSQKPAARRALLTIGIIVVIAAFVWYFRIALLPVVLGLFIAYLLAPAVRFFERRGLRTTWSILLVYVLLGGFLCALGIYVVPRAVTQLEKLVRALPEYSAMIAEHLQRTEEGMYRIRLPRTLQTPLLDTVDRAEQSVQEAVQGFIDTGFAFMGYAFSLLAAPVLSFYFLSDRKKIIRQFLSTMSEQWHGPVLDLMDQLDGVLMGFIRSRLIISAFVGFSVSMVFVFLGLPYSLLVGLFAGILDLIPYFGPILGGIPALATAVTESTAAAFKVGAALVIIQQIESAVISPLVMGDEVHLHPIWVVIALFVGAQLGGIIGMILAVPAFASLRVIISFLIDHWQQVREFML